MDLEGKLTLKDRINYNYLLGVAILTLQRSISTLDKSDREIRESVALLVDMIPSPWKDSQFNKEYKEAVIVQQIDVRPRWCGQPATIDWCLKHGVPVSREETTYKYHKLLQAAFDLMERRAMLSRKKYTEKMTGRKFKGTRKDSGEVPLEDLPLV